MKQYPVTPIGKPRQTQRDKWKQRPAVMRYRAFCDEVRARGVAMPAHGAHVTFVIPMPKSWPQWKRQQYNGRPHLAKPDADNLIKALLDAVYGEDCGVWDFRVTKIWGEEGAILVSSVAEEAA